MIELDEDFDVASRELCPDGSCTGVLDADGVCKVCGARGTAPAASASERAPAASASERAPAEAATTPTADDADFLATRSASDAEFDERRELCPDGNCIGVLDADGRCKVCGRTIT